MFWLPMKTPLDLPSPFTSTLPSGFCTIREGIGLCNRHAWQFIDGTRTLHTDLKGAYAFDNVTPGRHWIVAQLPPAPRAFFTTPSHSEAEVGAHVDFGLVWTAARIDGRVISDLAGRGEWGHGVSTGSPASRRVGVAAVISRLGA